MDEHTKTELDKHVGAGVIEPDTSVWVPRVVLAPKKNVALRLCVDYRLPDTRTLSNSYPLARIEDNINFLGVAAVFSTLDFSFGYWKGPVVERDDDETALTTQLGT